MDIDFYKAFEDKYRGTRDVIKSRLLVYLPFILPLLRVYPDGHALDLGCGRGEWLEILLENGFNATGVDIDKHMLLEGEKLGLNLYCGDALNYLKKVPDASQVVISAFHMVEHISFADLQQLVFYAHKALVPGGLLIMETPNPENLMVGSCSFYTDPTHNKPIPPNLLAFVPEYYGYQNIKVLRLQEDQKLLNSFRVSLVDVLRGASPDYAIVAQKSAGSEILNLTKKAFDKQYGITVEQLAAYYQRGINTSLVKSKFKNLAKVLNFFRKLCSTINRLLRNSLRKVICSAVEFPKKSNVD